ncbi:MAG: hypothetical protein Q9195_007292 [Heterodermia aff. obscurata]
MFRYHLILLPLFLLSWLQASRSTTQASSSPQETITISSQVFVVDPTAVVLNSKTVSPGGAPVEVNGVAVSADLDNDLFINGAEVITMSEGRHSSNNSAPTTTHIYTPQSGASTGIFTNHTQISSPSNLNSTIARSTNSHYSTGTASRASPRSGSLTSISIITSTAGSSNFSTGATAATVSSPTLSLTEGTSSTYTLAGVTFTGNPTSLAAGSTTLTPGGSPLTSNGHTFIVPATATSGIISVDGKPTTLLLPSAPDPSSEHTLSGSSSTTGGLGVGLGPVGSITLSDASTTVTYDEVVLTKYSTIQTPTVIVTDFPELNSEGSTTSVHGSLIVGKGGTVLIHPPSLPTASGSIGPLGLGGPIRPPSGSSGCPSFFGISFCPPSINIEPPGSTDIDPGNLPDGIDPNNPDNSENHETDPTRSQEQTSSSNHETSIQSTVSQPSSVSATTTESTATSKESTSSSVSSSTGPCSASGCGCVTLSYAPDSTPNPLDDDTNEMRKRKVGGRFIRNKRGKDVYYSTATNSVGQGACEVNRFTIKPSYPGPAAVTNNEGGQPTPQMVAFYQTAAYWAVPTTPPKCGAPVWGFLDTTDLSNQAKGGPWAIGGNKKSVNVDHVYEVSLLDEFFSAQITAGVQCTDITALFDVNDGSTGGTRLNTIFGQLPSLTNPDFVGMDAALNRLKGSLWNPDLEGSNLGCANSNACVQSLSNLAVIMAIANNDKVKELFSASNGRIYAAFKGIDNLITAQAACNNPIKGAEGDLKATWADAYSVWMTDKVKSNNDLITKTAAKVSASISTDVNAAPQNKKGQVQNWSKFVSNFNVAYTKVDSLTFPQPTVWPNNGLNIQKRADATEGAACSIAGTSASAGSTPKSASPSTSARSTTKSVSPSTSTGSTTTSAPPSTITSRPSTSPTLASFTSPGFTCTSSQ